MAAALMRVFITSYIYDCTLTQLGELRYLHCLQESFAIFTACYIYIYTARCLLHIHIYNSESFAVSSLFANYIYFSDSFATLLATQSEQCAFNSTFAQ